MSLFTRHLDSVGETYFEHMRWNDEAASLQARAPQAQSSSEQP